MRNDAYRPEPPIPPWTPCWGLRYTFRGSGGSGDATTTFPEWTDSAVTPTSLSITMLRTLAKKTQTDGKLLAPVMIIHAFFVWCDVDPFWS